MSMEKVSSLDSKALKNFTAKCHQALYQFLITMPALMHACTQYMMSTKKSQNQLNKPTKMLTTYDERAH